MRYLTRSLLAGAAVALAACHESGRTPPPANAVTAGRILQYGVCEPGSTTEKYAQPDATAGYASRGNVMISKSTDTITLRKGVGFGYLWHASGMPPTFDLKYRIQHPPITRPDGKRAEMFEETVPHSSTEGEFETADCYFLTEPYEMVVGDWTMTLLVKDTVIVTKTFHVVEAKR